MYYDGEKMTTAWQRYRELTRGSYRDFQRWLGVDTPVSMSEPELPFHLLIPLYVGSNLEPHRVNLLLSPHYKALFKAHEIKHDQTKNSTL